MMRRKFICILCVLFTSGLFFRVYATSMPQKVSEHVTICVMDTESMQLIEHEVPIDYKQGDIADKANKTIAQMAKKINHDLGSDDLFPQVENGIKVTLSKDVATVDFSGEFVEKHIGGSLSEKLTIYMIVNTLTSMDEIGSVMFAVDGKEGAEFKGHFDMEMAYTYEN